MSLKLNVDVTGTILRGLLIGLMSLCAYGCASNRPAIAPSQEFRERTHVLAIAPLIHPPEIKMDPAKASWFRASIEASLGRAGFEVVPSTVYQRCYDQALRRMGPFIDSYSGAVDEEKARRVRLATAQMLAVENHSDAVLYPELLITQAYFRAETAEWDGVTEWTEYRDNLVPPSFSPPSATGQTPALSLSIIVEDTNGEVQYKHRGGVQLLAKQRSMELVPIPADQVLADPERAAEAVRIALEPLVTQR